MCRDHDRARAVSIVSSHQLTMATTKLVSANYKNFQQRSTRHQTFIEAYTKKDEAATEHNQMFASFSCLFLLTNILTFIFYALLVYHHRQTSKLEKHFIVSRAAKCKE